MNDKFKTRVQWFKDVQAVRNRILFGFLILSLELLNPLNLELGFAQSELFIKVKPSASSSA